MVLETCYMGYLGTVRLGIVTVFITVWDLTFVGS